MALILRLRASHPDIYVDDFREELPAVLLSTILADGLYAEGRRTILGALLRPYCHLGGSTEAPLSVVPSSPMPAVCSYWMASCPMT